MAWPGNTYVAVHNYLLAAMTPEEREAYEAGRFHLPVMVEAAWRNKDLAERSVARSTLDWCIEQASA